MAYQVLVVDDDPQTRVFLKEALERQQYAVSLEPHAEAAVEAVKADGFDLILMDVRLPGMSGLEAVDAVRNADRRAPIIVMTAHGTRDTALEAVRRGAYDYFTKPLRLDEMDIVMRRALEKRRLLAELDWLREQAAAGAVPPIAGASDGLQSLTLDEKVAQLERAFVVEALTRTAGVQAAAARLLGVTERSVWHLVKKHRIDVARMKSRVQKRTAGAGL